MTLIDWKKSAKLLPQRLPDFIREDATLFTAFLASYYTWQDNVGAVNYQSANFPKFMDIDETDESYVDWFHNEFMVRIPKRLLTDRRQLLKHIKQFYRAKGTARATRFLFRILFNEEIEFYYPGEDIFRASHSVWSQENSFIVDTSIGETELFAKLFKEIRGSTSGARTRIEKIVSFIENGAQKFELFHERVIGTFQIGEFLLVDNGIIGTLTQKKSYPGKYLTFDGHASDLKKLQDNSFYQEYSYVIKSGISFKDYSTIVTDLIHPIGTKLFGEFQSFSDLGQNVPSVDVEPFTFFIDVPDVEHSPTINTSIGFGSAFQLEIVPSFPISPVQVVSNTYSVNDNVLDGTIRSANSEVLNDYADVVLSTIASWSAETFTSGRGILGTGTAFTTDLAANDAMIVEDASNNETYNEVVSIDSDTTMRIRFPELNLANGTIHKI